MKTNIIEGNKLIAEFMELKPKYFNDDNLKCINPRYNDGTFSPVKFHSSWDWLMPVVEKIENLKEFRKPTVNINKTSTMVSVYSKTEKIDSFGNFRWLYGRSAINEDSKILACFAAIVDFIIWYNQNK